MEFPRRSASPSPQANNNTQRSQTLVPASGRSSQTSRTTTTSHPSPINHFENNQNTSQLADQSRCNPQLNSQPSMSQSHLDAPLPSPSAGDKDTVFGRPHPQPNPYQSSYPQHQQQRNDASPHPLANQNKHVSHHTSFQRDNNSFGQAGAPAADFLAEAAKRAQMACLMRDLGDVSL